MRKLDQRGVAAFEFCLVAVAFFTLVFAIFDLGRYAITMQSLRALAGAGARATMIQCYTADVIKKTSPSSCTDVNSYLTDTQKQNAAPFLYAGGLSPTLATTSGANALTVTASQPGFAMLMPIWGASLNAPSASTKIPF
ncbi:TadE/TadG family type IV pilus assembly protein [Bradyrhizobium sp. GCM10027634]|uniref:TadE/TadG family type IV pilus assembly protein n=1 Tax=unclassified Bradyrhizobium TaxID=2631580 RepID=UPI00263B943E|nr:TadE family protein [Bradyrhizobium sp. WYCCWR 12677]MDN5005308.1 pilus assembly protein [Bradyrhizobium sp. WYCCWR 12677]